MPDSFGPDDFAAATGVSHETLARLKAYAGLLADWNARHNLVSARSLDALWQRHMWDSAQLAPLIPPAARTLADLGSGAGFPGLVLAAMLGGRLSVTLYDATAKKCAFLAAAANRMGLKITIINARLESLTPTAFDVVTARACAPLPRLLSYAWRFGASDGLFLFLKGQNVGPELTEARKSWSMKARQIASLTDPSGTILALKDLSPR